MSQYSKEVVRGSMEQNRTFIFYMKDMPYTYIYITRKQFSCRRWWGKWQKPEMPTVACRKSMMKVSSPTFLNWRRTVSWSPLCPGWHWLTVTTCWKFSTGATVTRPWKFNHHQCKRSCHCGGLFLSTVYSEAEDAEIDPDFLILGLEWWPISFSGAGEASPSKEEGSLRE